MDPNGTGSRYLVHKTTSLLCRNNKSPVQGFAISKDTNKMSESELIRKKSPSPAEPVLSDYVRSNQEAIKTTTKSNNQTDGGINGMCTKVSADKVFVAIWWFL